jgi:hypothetical protein
VKELGKRLFVSLENARCIERTTVCNVAGITVALSKDCRGGEMCWIVFARVFNSEVVGKEGGILVEMLFDGVFAGKCRTSLTI